MIRALIFDFDGLILDTEGPEYRSWQETFAAYGAELPHTVWLDAIGTANGFDPYDLLAQHSGRPVDRAAVRMARQARFDALMAEQGLMPGVLDYVGEAKRRRIKLGVASSSDRAWVTGWLARHGLLDAFDCIKCREDVVTVKPDPALYVEAVRALQVLPHEAIALEDSLNGTRAARQAGLFCVAVPNPLLDHQPFDQAHLRLHSLPEMPLDRLIQQASRWAASQARAAQEK